MNIPKDPAILLSFINTKLRDSYASIDEMCDDLEIDKETIVASLRTIGYEYNYDRNAFV